MVASEPSSAREGQDRRIKAVPLSWGRQELVYVPGVQPVPHLVGNGGTTAQEPDFNLDFSLLTCSSLDRGAVCVNEK